MHPNHPSGRLAFGDFVVDLHHATLHRGPAPIHLTPKAFSVLAALLRSGGEPVSKESLIREVWSDSIGTEANLSVNVAALRRALGEGPRDHRYIVTLPLFGYRFVGETRELEPTSPAVGEPPGHREIRVAVLPFRIAGEDPGHDLLAFGLTEGLISELARHPDLVVPGSGSVRRLTEDAPDPATAARELRVDYVVEGSLRRDGVGWIATVELVRGADGTAVWGTSSRVNHGEGLQLPASLAAMVAAALGLPATDHRGRLEFTPPTADEAAYDLYLQGRRWCLLGDPSSLLKAVGFLEQATARDSGFAVAWSQLAEALLVLWIGGIFSARDVVPRVLDYSGRARVLRPDIPCPYVNLGNVAYLHDWDWERSRDHFLHAIDIAPNNARCYSDYAIMLVLAGQVDEAVRAVLRAQEIDPLSPLVGTRVALVHLFAGRQEQSIRIFDRILEIRPDFYWGHHFGGVALIGLKRYGEAAQALRRAEQSNPGIERPLAVRACAEAKAGNRHFAEDALRRIEAMPPSTPSRDYDLALITAYLGDVDRALRHLEDATAARDARVPYLACNPMWDPFRDHPAFRRLVDRILGTRLSPSQ